MSNITSCDSGSFSTEKYTGEDADKLQYSDILGKFHSSNSHTSTTTKHNSNCSNPSSQQPPPVKKKRNLPGNPDPNAEVLALSPNTLVATNRFICEICNKGFQRDQNLQLHQRSHNLPWKLKQRTSPEVRKRVYICPEPSCVHHNPARALGDLTGIKKHFNRKHGEKKWKCDKCSKKYAVYSDYKAHSKICGTKEYKCDCGTIFSRKDCFITHRAFCDALSEENNKVNEGPLSKLSSNFQSQQIPSLVAPLPITTNIHNPSQITMSKFNNPNHNKHPLSMPNATKPFNNMASNSFDDIQLSSNSLNMFNTGSPNMSATALLQKAAQMGATMTEKSSVTTSMAPSHGVMMNQHMYNFNNGNGSMNGVDMFNAILDQSKALSKILENNSRSISNNVVGGTKRSDEDVMTLDLLGVGAGGGGANGNFYSLAQQSETAATNEVIWRNWSTTKNAGLGSFSATGNM